MGLGRRAQRTVAQSDFPIHIGPSGWSDAQWTNVLYAAGLPSERRRGYYVPQFRTVEINASDYRWPTDVARAPQVRDCRVTVC
jgi:hypothetical protein